MKKILILGSFMTLSLLMAYFVGCTPKGTPVTSTLGTANPYPAAGPAVFPVLYNNGIQSAFPTPGNTFLYSGNSNPSLGYATLNPQDYVDKGYGGDAYSYEVSWSANAIANMNGYSGMILSEPATNFGLYTTCTFWAKANQNATVQFQAGGSGNNPESLTTTWTQYSITVPSASSTGYFAVLILAAPATAPLNVLFDRVVFNGAATNTPTMTQTPTNTTNGTYTATPTMTSTATVTNTMTPLAFYNGTTGTLVSPAASSTDFGSCCGSGQTASNMTFSLQGLAFPYAGNTYALDFTFLSFPSANYMGEQIDTSGSVPTYSTFTVCTFYARTNRPMTAGNVIEFNATGNNISGLASSYPGSVAAGSNLGYTITTTYAQYTIPLGSPVLKDSEMFNVVINNSDVTDLGTSGALELEIDNVQYQ